jgi:hypothetical protein
MSKHQWADDQVAWLREQYLRMDRRRLLAAFNEFFGCKVTVSQLRGAMGNHNIRQHVRTGRFVADSEPWNKGVTGYMGPNRTSFRKGNTPHNAKQLWHERIGKDGYVEMQVPERNPYTGYPTRYKQKHVWIWEQAHGKRPKGCAIIFKDGDRSNFDLENLELVTRRELLVLNQRGYRSAPDELKPVILALAKMEAKAGIKPPRCKKEGM